uniref:Uncharacterized protein n=1 Tax=Arundo donax TaxID=35708 RepID=A0A0A9DVP5_ARUDO
MNSKTQIDINHETDKQRKIFHGAEAITSSNNQLPAHLNSKRFISKQILCPHQHMDSQHSLLRNSNQLLPDIAPGEEADERRRRILEPVDNVLDVADLPLLEVPHNLLLELAVPAEVVEDHEPLHAHALGHELEQVVRALGVLQVILRDHPAHGDPPAVAHVEQHRVQRRAAYVLEVDVDALRETPGRAVTLIDITVGELFGAVGFGEEERVHHVFMV